jgi:2-keto-myo-inositol isomerase
MPPGGQAQSQFSLNAGQIRLRSIPERARRVTMSFRYCLNASTIRPTPLAEKISVAAQAGYSGIELWHDELEAYCTSGGTIAEVRRMLGDAGLEVPTTIYLRNWCDTVGVPHRLGLDECERRMDVAAELNAPHCIASPAAGTVDVSLAANNYAELLELGQSRGVLPSFEYLGFVQQLCTLESAIEIVELSGHPQATIIIDPFHNYRGGGSFETLQRLRPEQIAISHFNDTPADPPRAVQHDEHRVMPGEGCLDLSRWIQLLQQIGYRGWLSLELFNERLWRENPLLVARDGLQRMQRLTAGL